MEEVFRKNNILFLLRSFHLYEEGLISSLKKNMNNKL